MTEAARTPWTIKSAMGLTGSVHRGKITRSDPDFAAETLMRTLLALAMVAFLAFAPTAAHAQTVSLAPVAGPQDTTGPSILGMTPDQALTVGVGILAGAFIMDLVVSNGPTVLIGAVAGALIGNWWFSTRPPVAAVTRTAGPEAITIGSPI
jgi:hypothetical protein